MQPAAVLGLALALSRNLNKTIERNDSPLKEAAQTKIPIFAVMRQVIGQIRELLHWDENNVQGDSTANISITSLSI